MKCARRYARFLGNARLLQNAAVPEDERCRLAEEMALDIRRLSDLDTQLLRLTELRHEKTGVQPGACPAAVKRKRGARRPSVKGHRNPGGRRSGRYRWRPGALALLLDNLTLNALRASKAGQTVILRSLPNGFAVEDQGIGMTQEQIARAREPFYKADPARTRRAGGVGLGLTLCGQIAALHRGELSIISAPAREPR